MKTRVTQTPLAGLLLVHVDYFQDERGFFIEVWHKRDFAEAGLPFEFVQDSHSGSSARVLRGLHYQDMRAPMGKLVRCTTGRIFDVAVDLRVSSTTFGKWLGIELTPENKTGFYEPAAEGGIAWNDPDIAIRWPFPDPILSKRDQSQMSLKQYLKNPAFK